MGRDWPRAVLTPPPSPPPRAAQNGSPALLDSLVVANDADQQLLAAAYNAGYSEDGYVTLSEAPKAVNVIVGGTATLAATAMYLAKYLIKNDALALTDEYGDDRPPPLLDSDDELLRSWHGVSYIVATRVRPA